MSNADHIIYNLRLKCYINFLD